MDVGVTVQRHSLSEMSAVRFYDTGSCSPNVKVINRKVVLVLFNTQLFPNVGLPDLKYPLSCALLRALTCRHKDVQASDTSGLY